MKLTLFHYWRSSASWRVRFGLFLKNVQTEYVKIDILKGENDSSDHLKRNPMGYVPTLLVEEKGKEPYYLSESLAILEWLEEIKPEPRLYPGTPELRAKIRQLSETINAGIQPLQNLNVLDRVSLQDQEVRAEWSRFFIGKGLEAYQEISKTVSGDYSVGNNVTAADACLIPQLYNARRYELDLSPFPHLLRVEKNLMKLEAYEASHPDRFQ